MKFLIIQTAFIGDVILATSLVEKIHKQYPNATIDFVLRKGNEGLLNGHPFINKIIIWDKKQNKINNLLSVAKQVRKSHYEYVINIQRFASSGIIAGLSGAKFIIGFDKNPLSFLFTNKIKHEIGNGKHEIERNQKLVESFTDAIAEKPKLYPSQKNYDVVSEYKTKPYVCLAPTSVWFTKQFPKEKWVELISLLSDYNIYLLGAPSDFAACEWIKSQIINPKSPIVNLAGKLNFLESAALMRDAAMNYVNDSAPMHIASAMNAATTAIFCSTVPAFGFGPLADNALIVETTEQLDCRPCGLHGYKTCPKGHFKCGYSIDVEKQLIRK